MALAVPKLKETHQQGGFPRSQRATQDVERDGEGAIHEGDGIGSM